MLTTHSRLACDDILHAFVEQSITGFYVVQDGQLVFVNAGLAAMTGYAVDELLGREALSLIAPEDRQLVGSNIGGRLRGEIPSQRYTFRLLHKEGHAVTVEVLAWAADHRGRPAVAGVLVDITERDHYQRCLEKSEAKFRAVFDEVQDVIFRSDADGCWEMLNPAWEVVTGFPLAESLGRSLLDYVHPDDRAESVACFERLIRRETDDGRHQVRFLTKDGGYRWIGVHVHIVLDDAGEIRGTMGTLRDITDRVNAEQALRENNRRLQQITAVLSEGLYVIDAAGHITYMNPAAETLLGWRAEEVIGKNSHTTFHHTRPDGASFPVEECPFISAVRRGESYWAHEDALIRKDGTFLPVFLAVAPLIEDGRVTGSVVAFHDITARQERQRALRRSEERYRALFHGSMDAVFAYRLDADRLPTTFIEVNEVTCQWLGYSRMELLRLGPLDIYLPESTANLPATVEQLCLQGKNRFERVLVAKDGRRIPVEITARIFDFEGEATIMAQARDITERKAAEERIHHLAHYDALTDLPNRRLMQERLEQALAAAERHQRVAGVILLDLDGFKDVNDTFGHDTGDELLKAVAHRLQASVRRSDTVCRMGGDEFLVVLSELVNAGDAGPIAGKLIEQINRPVYVGGRELHVGASAGVAVFPHDGRTVAAVMKAADIAMYRAKAQGCNRFAFGPAAEIK